MKIKIDDEMLSILVISSLKADAKVLRKPLNKMSKRFASLSEVEFKYYLKMQQDYEAVVKVLEYYGVSL